MYIVYRNGKFEVSDDSDFAVVKIEAPVYIENKEESQLSAQNAENGAYVYSDACNRVDIKIEKKSNTLFYIHRSWKNLSVHSRKIQTVARIQTCFDVKKYLIPCVSVNGNEFGNGSEPKGLEKDGKKWIFGYDRVSVPSCTLTENDDFAVAFFASDESDVFLLSSCCVSKNKGTGAFIQEIYHPVIESPVTYSSRDSYAEGYETFVELKANESFECGMYLSVLTPK